MTDGPSEIDWEALQKEIAESMRWATLAVTYDDLSKEAKSVVHDMKRYSLASALPILAGLLTIPDYQSNCIRIELLVGLAIFHCAGRKKADLGQAARWYRRIEQTRCVTGEDPAEDVFVILIHSDEGNFRMLEGVWENAGFYTQCVAEVVEGLPPAKNFEQLKRSFRALLKISDAVCERASLERYQLGDDTLKAELRLAKIARKNALMNRVTFSSSEFDDLGITPADIFPFLSNKEDLKDLSSQTPGDSFCEHRPIVRIGPDRFVIALPSALSVCARNLVVDFVTLNGFEAQFDRALSSVFSKTLFDTPLLGGSTGAPTLWRDIDGFKFSTFVPCLSGCHPYPLHLGCSQSPE